MLTVAYPRADQGRRFTIAARHLSDSQAAVTYQGVNEDYAGHLRAAPYLPLAPEGCRNSQKMS